MNLERFFRVALTVLSAVLLFLSCTRTDQKAAGPAEKVTIAISATTESVLAEVAQVKGFFRQEGLETTVRKHPYGRPCLEDMLSGRADFATVAETPVMFAIMRGEKISVITTIESSQKGNAIIARKDRGIHAVKDLRSKSIGVTLGTVSDFFLDAILVLNGISRKDVEVINLTAEKMSRALADGDIDAASTFNPYTSQAQKKLGDRGVAFQDENIYTWTFNVVSRQEFIRNNAGKIKKLLRALIKAEEFVTNNPEEAQKIVADFSGIDIGIIRSVWAETNFRVSLDQSLVLALEDESLWAIRNRLTRAAKLPNYLNFIYQDGLQGVKPDAVTILR